MNRILYIVIIVLVIAGIAVSAQKNAPKGTTLGQSTSSPSMIGTRTKSSGCQVQGALQDKDCTPGAIDQTLTKDVLCSPTFSTKSIRNVPAAVKNQVYDEYGIASHRAGQYEVDHLVSLELGGRNDIANLWPEAAEPRPGYHEKDRVENYLHAQVCSGALSLVQAQQEIASDWLTLYNQMPK